MQGFPTTGYCLRLKLLGSNNFIPFHCHCLQVLLLWCGQPPSIKQELIGVYAALIWSKLSGRTNPVTVASPRITFLFLAYVAYFSYCFHVVYLKQNSPKLVSFLQKCDVYSLYEQPVQGPYGQSKGTAQYGQGTGQPVRAKYGQACAHTLPLLARTSPYHARTGPVRAFLLGTLTNKKTTRTHNTHTSKVRHHPLIINW